MINAIKTRILTKEIAKDIAVGVGIVLVLGALILMLWMGIVPGDLPVMLFLVLFLAFPYAIVAEVVDPLNPILYLFGWLPFLQFPAYVYILRRAATKKRTAVIVVVLHVIGMFLAYQLILRDWAGY